MLRLAVDEPLCYFQLDTFSARRLFVGVSARLIYDVNHLNPPLDVHSRNMTALESSRALTAGLYLKNGE